MLTLKKVNKEIQVQFPEVELVKGDGYYYYAVKEEFGGNPHWIDLAYTTSVMVPRLNDLPLEVWVSEIQGIYAECVSRG